VSTIFEAKKENQQMSENTGPLDPPILVGGGGSTLIWIRKDQNARKISAGQVPDTAMKPGNPEMYDVYVLDNFDCSNVKVDHGGSGNPIAHSMQGKKHHTQFQ